MYYKCLSEECGRTFYILGRISRRLKRVNVYDEDRTIESPCCPYCGSVEFEIIEEKKE